MQHTMQYSVGGEIYNIPADKNEEFLKAAGDRAEPASRYRVGKDVYTIPQSQDADFKATLEQSGMAADPVRSVTMADGSRRDFTMPEMSRFLRSKEYRDSADFTAPEQGSPSFAAIKGFGGEMVGQLGGSAQTIRDTAESANPVYKGYAYAQDLANSLVGGLLAGSAKIEQGVGNLIGNEAVVNDALAGQRMVQNTMPTDMLDTTGGGIVNRVLQTGKGVASVTGEFAPAAIPGVGAAYGAAVVSGGAVNRGVEVYDNAIANGMTPFQAASLANGAASVDAVQNLLLMGKFRGIWGGAERSAAEGVKRGLVAKLTGVAKDAVRTGAIMGAGAATQNVIDQTAQNTDEVDWKKTADAGFDGFIEGGMFHLLNAGAHYAANPVSWVRESKTAPSGYVRDALDTAEGRALLFANNPEAAKEIYLARKDGKDVSRAMLKKANIPEDVAKDVANRNAIGDALVEDYNAYRGWVNNTELKYEVGKQRAAEERVAAEKQQAEVGWKRMEEREGREAENERARIEEADARATEEAHAARRDELTQAFADWSEAESAVDSAVKAQKSGNPSGIKAAQAALEEAKTRAQERIAKMDDNSLLDEIDAMSAVENPDAKVARQLGAMREEAIKRGIVGKDNASTIATENEKVSQDTAVAKLKGVVAKNGHEVVEQWNEDNGVVAIRVKTDEGPMNDQIVYIGTDGENLGTRFYDDTLRRKSTITSSPKPDGKGRMVEKEAPVVEKTKGEVSVEAPDDVEAKIAKMPYGQERRQAQFDYMNTEVKKAKAAIEGKFKQHSDKSGWTRADDSEIAPKVTIKVPADGEFTVLNNPDGIAKLEKIAAKLKSQIAEPQRMIPKFKRTPDTFAGYSVNPNGWEVDKPETMPKPPSLTVKSQGKSISEADAVKIAKPFASTDKLRKATQKVHVEDGKVVATDGRRIIVIDAPGAKAKGNEGEYVNWRSVIPKGEPAHEVKLPTAELYTKLVQAKVVADVAVSEGAYHNPIIELYDVDGKIGVIAKSDGASYSTHEEMPDSARLIGKFNVDFLIDAVEAAAKFGEKECNIGYNGDYSPIVQSGRNHKQVIMPMRIDDAPATVAEAVEESPEAPLGSPAPSGTGRLSQREIASEGVGTGVRPWYKRINHALTSPNAIINEARKLFPEFAFRERGTARMPNALGHWEPQRSLIRSQDISSIKVISHEIGHGIDQWTKKNPAVVRSPEVKRELLKLGRDLYGNQKPNGGYEAEGFAEYMMGYITGQDTAKVAPAVDRWFRETYARHNPKWMERIDKLRRMVDDLRMQTPQEEVRAFQRPVLSLMDRAWSKVKRMFSEEMWSDDIAPLRRGFEKAGVAKELYEWQNDFKKLSDLVKEGNGSTKEADDLRASIKQKIETNPYLFASNVRGTQSQRAMDMARFGTTNLMGTELIGNVVMENGKVKMKNGKAVRDNNSESLRDIFRGWSDEAIADWQDYAIAKAGLENYLANGKEFGLQRRTLEAVVNHLETPEFKDALKRYSDYAHRILSNGVEAGYFDWDTYANIVNKNPHYVRITRRMVDEFNANVTEGSGGQPVYRRKGGTQNVLPPIDALMMDVDRMMGRFFAIATQKRIIEGVMKGEKLTSFRKGEAKAIAVNLPVRVNNEQEGVKFTSDKIRKEFVERAQRALIDTGKIPADLEGLVTNYKGKAMTVEEAAAQELYDNMFGEDGAQLTIFRERPANGKGGRISAYVNGKLETFEVPDEKWIGLLDGIETRSELSKLEKIANIATTGVRLGATTINPEFALRNGIRDSLHAAIMSETGAVPLVSTASGMVEQVLGTDVQRLFTAMGGTMSDLIGMTKEDKWKNAGMVAVSGSDADNAAIRSAADKLLEIKNEIQSNVVKGSVKAVADVLQVPEMGPRLREFKGVLAKLAKVGIEGDAAKMLALAHGKDISIDFQRAGKAMRSINHLIPFSNACVRGTEQFMRNLGAFDNLPHQFETSRGKRAVKTLAKGALELTATCGSFALYQMMTMSEEERQKEFERPSTEKWEYINIAGYRIPLPFEAGLLFAGLPKALIYEAYGDKGAVADWAKTTAKALPLRYANVGDAIMSIAAIDPFVEIAINRNWQGKPIVNELTKRNKERKDWYDFSTTTPAKVLGAFTNKLFGKDNAVPPAYIDHFLNAYTGGAWKRVLSPNQSILRNPLQTFNERKGNSRIVSEFYDSINQFAQSYGSKNISADDYGRYRAGEALKENISADFEEARKLIDADISPKEREKRRVEIMERIQDKIRNHNKRTDFRQLGIAHAVANLTTTKVEEVDPDVRDKSMAVLKGVSLDEARMALREYARAHKWSGETMMKRVSRLKKHFR